MARVIENFFLASLFTWITPIAILYGFNDNWIPGLNDLSPYSLTLLSRFLAVISVNIVIAFYIYMALKEQLHKHEHDASFLADAKGSISQSTRNVDKSPESSKKQN